MEKAYTVALVSSIVSLDPTREDDLFSQHVISQVYESLFGYNKSGDVMPLLVKDWKAVNEKEYYFTLKNGISFHDRGELTSDDVIASFEKILSKESMIWWALNCINGAKDFHEGKSNGVEGLHKIDKYKLRVQLSEPFSPFIRVLSSPYASIMPARLVRSNHNFEKAPVGTGPYFITCYNGEKELSLSSFEYYHGGDVVVKKVKVLTSIRDSVHLFNERKIDYVPVFNKKDEARIDSNNKSCAMHQHAPWFVAFNLDSTKVDPTIRRALYYGIDKTVLCSKEGEYADITDSFIPTGLLGSRSDHFTNVSDIKKAKALVDKLPSSKRDLEIVYPEKIRIFPSTLALLKNTCKTIGIRCTHKILPIEKLVKALECGGYQAAVLHLSPSYRDTDGILYPYFHSENPSNLINLRDKKVDDLLTKARNLFNDEIRSKYYLELDDYLCSNAYVIPLYFEKAKLFFSSRITGFSVYGMNIYDLQYKHMTSQATSK